MLPSLLCCVTLHDTELLLCSKSRFALAYPLVDPDAGLSPAPHHTATTASILAKQRPKAPATSVGAPFGTTSGYATGGTSVTGGYATLGAGATIAAAGSVGGGSTTSPRCRATVVANARRTSDVGVMAAAAAAAACQAEAVTGLSAALQTRVVPVVALQDLLAGMKARLQVRVCRIQLLGTWWMGVRSLMFDQVAPSTGAQTKPSTSAALCRLPHAASFDRPFSAAYACTFSRPSANLLLHVTVGRVACVLHCCPAGAGGVAAAAAAGAGGPHDQQLRGGVSSYCCSTSAPAAAN